MGWMERVNGAKGNRFEVLVGSEHQILSAHSPLKDGGHELRACVRGWGG